MDAFHKLQAAKDGLQKKCKKCSRELGSVRYQANKEFFDARNKEWKNANRELSRRHARRSWLRRKYGITEEKWKELFDNQSGCCAICGVKSKDSARCWGHELVVDHDHNTGEIRGLLCTVCNLALGGFEDKTLWVQSALDYLHAV